MNIADQSSIDKNQVKLAEAKAGRAVVIRALCGHREGRNFLWWLCEQGAPYASSMRFDSSERGDPMRTSYAEGWRGLGTLILGEIMNASPSGYVLMLTENRNVETLEKQNGRSESDSSGES